MKVKLVTSLVLALLAFVFITQNTDVVMVNFLSWSVEISIVLLVFIMLGVGIIIGWSLNSYLRFVRNRKRTKGQGNTEMQSNIVRDNLTTNEKEGVEVQEDKELS